MRRLNKDQRNYIIIGLSIITLVMAVGYAAFASRLNINGTSEVTSTWNVRFTSIEAVGADTIGGATDKGAQYTNISDNGLTASFYANLESPNDSITYKIKVENLGSLNAKLTLNENFPNNPNVSFEKNKNHTGLDTNSVLNANDNAAGGLDEGYVYYTVTYNSYSGQTSPTGNDRTVSGSVTLDFTQSSSSHVSAMHPTDIIGNNNELYADSAESGRYIFKGTNPDNYVTFNNETAGWRIVSIESDGTMKIVKNTNLTTMAWDAINTRNKTTSTFCVDASSYGCNAWAATANLVGNQEEFTTSFPNGDLSADTITYSGTVTQDASLNTYLKDTYYDISLGTDKEYIQKHNFYVGTPGSSTDKESIDTNSSQEKNYTWEGFIGLITATDYMKASTDSACTSLATACSTPYPCGNGNYLKPSTEYVWTLSPYAGNIRAYHISSSGSLDAQEFARDSYGVRPALFLKSTINLAGTGTSGDPYRIIE